MTATSAKPFFSSTRRDARVVRLGVGDDPAFRLLGPHQADERGHQLGPDAAADRRGLADGVVHADVARLGTDLGRPLGVVLAAVPLAPADRTIVVERDEHSTGWSPATLRPMSSSSCSSEDPARYHCATCGSRASADQRQVASAPSAAASTTALARRRAAGTPCRSSRARQVRVASIHGAAAPGRPPAVRCPSAVALRVRRARALSCSPGPGGRDTARAGTSRRRARRPAGRGRPACRS